ncbi:hypothetical protein [uncultured Weeksella sp.]|uniref:Uncharacterized protein n=1 Tax=Weeksella virosa (strain ATCC 43766 / DSM 16922 / JCM 21250 / CCUG 30538 / CDC 9751 / IAM 14551 / NBRC 16016 / NCTC 11634 / CL345/78) TaxID=865938 RepID=F0P0T3_WEEVC|nr:hypothetical protein [uncultured Weeksella sp.]ADX67497.1 hypothetical protein Weevi_0784 [Weeksella virosa DSM 16922]SUP53792.1 Uncharacterised protein [Weeksella virosa]VEH62759.1 Uncharacterised protein [Weeksella virosa]
MNILVFVFLLLPVLYQLFMGFRAKERKQLNSIGLQSAVMQIIGTVVGWILFNQIGSDFKTIVIYTGFTFLLCIGSVLMVQHILLIIRNQKK